MVKRLKKWLANVIDELIAKESISGIKKIDDTATDALIRFNECNEKVDSTGITIEQLAKQVQELQETINMLTNEQPSNLISRAEILDEWLNGKEAKNGYNN